MSVILGRSIVVVWSIAVALSVGPQRANADILLDLLSGKLEARMKAQEVRKEQMISIMALWANEFDRFSEQDKQRICLHDFPNALAAQVVAPDAERKLMMACQRLAAGRMVPKGCPLGVTADKTTCWHPSGPRGTR